MTKTPKLARRTFLKGAGTAMALPYLETMMPSSAVALSRERV
jgi:hypothetical protein